MNYLKSLIVTILSGFSFYSCNPCNYLDCITDNYYGQFRITSATNGKDLIFGTNKIYDKNLIKFYSLKNLDTTFFDSQSILFPGNGYDSILHVRFFPADDITYMRLSNGDIDTLNIFYNTFNTKCCGTITEITKFVINNSVEIPGDKGTQEIKK